MVSEATCDFQIDNLKDTSFRIKWSWAGETVQRLKQGDSMATSQEVINFIVGNYGAELSEVGIMTLQVPIENGRKQMVYAAVSEGALQVTSPVAWAERVDAERLLKSNTSMFGVVEINGAYALKHNAFIEDIDESEIRRALAGLAAYADEFEARLGFTDEF